MGTPRWLDADQERAWRGYRRMRTLLDLQIARDLNLDSGLSDADYDVLSTLSERQEAAWRSSDLAKHLLWSTSRLSHHIGRMESRGLVARQPTDNDGRGAVVTLTDQGWATLREAAPHHVESVRRNLVDLLDDQEIATMGRIAEKVIARLSK